MDQSTTLDVQAVLPPPEALIQACVERDCVLYAGLGIGAQAGLPTWRVALAEIIRIADERQLWKPSPSAEGGLDADQFSRESQIALETGKLAAVADLILTRLDRPILQSILQEIYGRPVDALPAICTALQSIPFASVLTANWNDLLERTFAQHPDYSDESVISIRDSSDFAERFRVNLFTIVRLYGNLSRAEAFVFTVDEYIRAIGENPELAKFLSSVFASRTFFFVGVSLESIELFLSTLALSAPSARRQFALVAWQRDIELQKERFLNRWGVELLTFVPSRDFAEVREFCEELRARVREKTPLLHQPPPPSSSVSAATLDKVVLSNIGPFEKLTLNFDQKWNVILGDNGTGKSTVLKAIALGLCGDDERSAKMAASLLRSGDDVTTGSIELTVGKDIYQTQLVRDGDHVRVRSLRLTRLQEGRWAVVGFPPLRGASANNPRGPSLNAQSPHPVVDDLLPILTGVVDYRIDAIKQWIVNVYTQPGEGGEGGQSPTERNLKLITSFFDVVGSFTPGLRLAFKKVTPSYRVLVETDDGIIPIDRLSQGMSSILGWVGTLLQRMYAIYPRSEKPESESALVLVDEIDAHMHPSWQQLLVNSLKRIFPKVQFIVTTHSPLVVGGLEPREVYRFERDIDGVVQISQPEYSLKGLGAAGLLTSGLFGLASHLDIETAEALDRKRQLTAKKLDEKIGLDELKELGELEERVADVDFTSSVRDPMYKQFVDAMSKVEARSQEGAGSVPIVLTEAEKKRKAELAEQIVRELMSATDKDSGKSPEDSRS
jgi:predicted ATPase